MMFGGGIGVFVNIPYFDKEKSDDQKAADQGKMTQERAEAASGALAQEILAGDIGVEAFGQRIIIRILQQRSFGYSGRPHSDNIQYTRIGVDHVNARTRR